MVAWPCVRICLRCACSLVCFRGRGRVRTHADAAAQLTPAAWFGRTVSTRFYTAPEHEIFY